MTETADLRLSAAVACHEWCPLGDCLGPPGRCIAHDVNFAECDSCGDTGIVGACSPEDLEPDQSPLEAWGYPCPKGCEIR